MWDKSGGRRTGVGLLDRDGQVLLLRGNDAGAAAGAQSIAEHLIADHVQLLLVLTLLPYTMTLSQPRDTSPYSWPLHLSASLPFHSAARELCCQRALLHRFGILNEKELLSDC